MKTKYAAPITIAIIVFAASTTTTTIAHYAEAWTAAYIVCVFFAFLGGIAGALMME